MVVDFDGELQSQWSHLWSQHANTLEEGPLMDTSYSEDSDDDIYLSLSESDNESTSSPHVCICEIFTIFGAHTLTFRYSAEIN